jgi:ATP-dependent exoDNAse (exonuclease V) beta subunit
MATFIHSMGGCKARTQIGKRKRSGDYNPSADAIQIMTMKVSKGLEFPAVELPGVGKMPALGEHRQEATRVLCVAATRAANRLVIVVGCSAGFGQRVTNQSLYTHD